MTWRKRDGFTLIEVLAVLTILGILASLLVPSVQSAIGQAKQTRAIHNMQQLGLLYHTLLQNGQNQVAMARAETVAEWALLAAMNGGENRPDLYVIAEDYLIRAQHLSPPQFIASWDGGHWQINGDFADFPLGVTIIVGVDLDCPSTTPIAYSRGLEPATGNWKDACGEDGGVYGPNRGLILFLDGHVEAINSLTDRPLLNFANGGTTTDIRRAVPPGARAINWRGTVWKN